MKLSWTIPTSFPGTFPGKVPGNEVGTIQLYIYPEHIPQPFQCTRFYEETTRVISEGVTGLKLLMF